MFKKFTVDEHISTHSKVKSSVQRNIRAEILKTYPALNEDNLAELLLPKKEPMILAKCQNRIQIVIFDGEPRFFNVHNGPYFPTLKILHKVPHIMKSVRADRGAIPFVLSGANVMCPGLTSPGATMETDIDSETPVAIMAEGKELAMAVGLLKLSTTEIRELNKGIAIELMHFLGDDLWRISSIE